MTFLLVEIFALMLAAFLFGAVLACSARKLFFGRTTREQPASAFEFAPAGPAARAPRVALDAAPATSAADRFARALTGAGTIGTTASAPASATVPKPVAAEPSSPPTPSPAAVAPEAPKPAARTDFTPVAAAAAALERARATIADTQAEAAAPVLSREVRTGIVTAEGAAFAPEPPAEHRDAPEPVAAAVETTALDRAAVIGAAPAVAAPVVTITIPDDAEDLTKIRSINPLTQSQLYDLGVFRYAQIARWTMQDVHAVNAALMGYGRVERENWIEQAAILARGGETEYSRSRRDTHSTGQGDDESQLDLAAAASPPAATGVMFDDARGATRPARLVEAIRENEERPINASSASFRGDLGALRSVRSEALTSTHGLVHLAPGQAPDDLKRIRGIGVLVEKKLNSLAITSYEQIAGWSEAEVERVSRQLDFQGRIERENWVGQARILAAERDADAQTYLN